MFAPATRIGLALYVTHAFLDLPLWTAVFSVHPVLMVAAWMGLPAMRRAHATMAGKAPLVQRLFAIHLAATVAVLPLITARATLATMVLRATFALLATLVPHAASSAQPASTEPATIP